MAETPKKFDIAILGSGPGGYPAAIKAAQMGKKVALIEPNEVGGTCLNRGCIPSKALIANAHLWSKMARAEEFGISITGASFDFAKMKARKDKTVASLRNSLTHLIASNGVTLIRGYGKFLSAREIKVNGEENCIVQADQTIIATGSEPRALPGFPIDGERIHDSTTMLNISELPKKIIIIGGGVIGCEFASLYNAFGVDVTVVELMERILPMECITISNALDKIFRKKNIAIKTSVKVEGVQREGGGITLLLSGGEKLAADMALVSVGRSLNSSAIGLDKAGVIVKPNGMIDVNSRMETNVPGIYAIGDLASKWWLAHVATHQGLVAARCACGEAAEMHYNAIPSVIFTDPEIGTAGKSLQQALDEGYPARLGTFPLLALGRSQAALETEGFAQVVVDSTTGQILGAQVIGAEASILIAEMASAIANELTLECVTETIHAHPTLAEAWPEAAFMAEGMPLHLPPRRVFDK